MKPDYALNGTAPEPGVYRDMDMEDYRSLPALSRSDIKRLAVSPGAFSHHVANGEDEPASEDMVLGSAVHTALLEPHLLSEQYAVAPNVRRRWKDATAIAKGYDGGEETWQAFVAENPGKAHITDKQAKLLAALRSKAEAIPKVGSLLSGEGDTEVTFVWKDPETGIMLKARPDRMFASKIAARTFLDLKTCWNARSESFSKMMSTHLYHIQGYMAMWGAETLLGECADAFLFLCWEKSAPYRAEAYKLSHQARSVAEEEMSAALRLYAKCCARGEWPDSTGRIPLIGLPSYRKEMRFDGWFTTGLRADEIDDGAEPF